MLKVAEDFKVMASVQSDMFSDDLTAWVLGVDRRMVLIESMKRHTILKAADIAQETNRSTQNISRALKEFHDMGLIRCLNPDKTTWKRYVLTDTGKDVLNELDGRYI